MCHNFLVTQSIKTCICQTSERSRKQPAEEDPESTFVRFVDGSQHLADAIVIVLPRPACGSQLAARSSAVSVSASSFSNPQPNMAADGHDVMDVTGE